LVDHRENNVRQEIDAVFLVLNLAFDPFPEYFKLERANYVFPHLPQKQLGETNGLEQQ